jgi:broad specificity phosphatase PhoE
VIERTRIVLVRHGEATCNVRRARDPWSPDHDAGLTPLGRRQAAAAAAWLHRAVRCDRLFASPLRRAVETADVLAARLGRAADLDRRLEEVRVSPGFDPTISVADWDGLLAARVADPEREVSPGLEPVAVQAARASEFLRERFADGVDAVVVSHALTIELMLLGFLGLGGAALARCRFKVSKTGVSILERAPDGSQRVVVVNSKAHLEPTTSELP